MENGWRGTEGRHCGAGWKKTLGIRRGELKWGVRDGVTLGVRRKDWKGLG